MDEISAAVQVIIRESQDKGIKSKSRHTPVFSGRDVHPLKYPVSVGGVMGAVSAQIKQDNNDTPFMCVTHGSSGWTVDLLNVQILARGNSGATGMSPRYSIYDATP